MKSLFWRNLQLMKGHIRILLLFELLYKAIAFAIVLPITAYIFQCTLKLSGYEYLANDNIIHFATQPLVIVLLIAAAFFYTFYILVETASLVIFFHACQKQEKISVWQMLMQGIKKSSRILKPSISNVLFVVYLLLMAPFVNIMAFSSLTDTIKMPEFAMDYITGSTWFTLLFCAGFFFLVIKMILWLFSIHFFVLEDIDFKEARIRSRSLIRGRFGKTVLIMVALNVGLIAAVYLVYITIIGFLYLLIGLPGADTSAMVSLLSVLNTFNAGVIAISSAIAVPCNFAVISSLYYKYLAEDGIVIQPILPPARPAPAPKIRRRSWAAIIALVALLDGCFIYGVTRDMVFDNVEILHHTDITCHRGYIREAPENTIPAIEQAIKVRAEFAEIDVQSTKDGVVVLSHDSNLKNTLGLDRNLWDVNYEEIADLEVQGDFSEAYRGTHIATLDEVIKQFRWLIRLNIELKPHDDPADLAARVVKIIEDNYAVDSCVISSLDAQALQEVKKLNPKIKTAYVMSVAYGNVTDLDFADILCVEVTFLTENLVEEAHAKGKEVYTWTVNSRESMQKALAYKVDNIITDDPLLAQSVIAEYKSNPLLTKTLHLLFNQ